MRFPLKLGFQNKFRKLEAEEAIANSWVYNKK